MFDIEHMHDDVYRKFDATPAKNITPYEFLKQHTTFTSHKYTIFSPHPPFNPINKNGKDIRLSRYACFCMFRDIPQLIFTRTFFMMPNASFQTIYKDNKKQSTSITSSTPFTQNLKEWHTCLCQPPNHTPLGLKQIKSAQAVHPNRRIGTSLQNHENPTHCESTPHAR